MNKMPTSLRAELDADPFYHRCARRQDDDCDGRITWEHSLTWAGKQMQVGWAIVPLCWYHHLGQGLDKAKNRWIALSRAPLDELKNYSSLIQLRSYLTKRFHGSYQPSI